MLDSVLERLAKMLSKKLIVDDEVFNFLVQKGYTRDLGARMLQSVICREIGNAIVTWQLNSDFKETDELRISLNHFKLTAA